MVDSDLYFIWVDKSMYVLACDIQIGTIHYLATFNKASQKYGI